MILFSSYSNYRDDSHDQRWIRGRRSERSHEEVVIFHLREKSDKTNQTHHERGTLLSSPFPCRRFTLISLRHQESIKEVIRDVVSGEREGKRVWRKVVWSISLSHPYIIIMSVITITIVTVSFLDLLLSFILLHLLSCVLLLDFSLTSTV